MCNSRSTSDALLAPLLAPAHRRFTPRMIIRRRAHFLRSSFWGRRRFCGRRSGGGQRDARPGQGLIAVQHAQGPVQVGLDDHFLFGPGQRTVGRGDLVALVVVADRPVFLDAAGLLEAQYSGQI